MIHQVRLRRFRGPTLIPKTFQSIVFRDHHFSHWNMIEQQMIVEFEEGGEGEVAVVPVAVEGVVVVVDVEVWHE